MQKNNYEIICGMVKDFDAFWGKYKKEQLIGIALI